MARGVNTPVDELDFYLDTRDISGPVLNVTATSTQTVNGADLQNTGPGAVFYVSFVSVVATATVRVNLQAKDPVSSLYFTIASLSVDGISVTTTGNPLQALYVMPGAATAPTNGTLVQLPMPRTFRVQASITVINATATSAVAMKVGMTRFGTN
jgi:hypothetical protein